MQSSNFTNPDIHTNVSVGSLELHLMNFFGIQNFPSQRWNARM